MARAIGYLRVSTAEQAESGAGLRAQEDAIGEHARRAGLKLVGPFRDEGIGGATPLEDRPGLVEAVAVLKPGDLLIVAKRDRLGRDPMVIALIEVAVAKAGARVVSAAGQGTEDDEPESILMRRIVDAFGEFERRIIKARTRSALTAKRRRGERTGAVPYGFDLVDDGRRSKTDQPLALVPNQAQQETMQLIRDLHLGGMSLREIGQELDHRGIPTKKGGPRWAPASVARILERTTQPEARQVDHATAS